MREARIDGLTDVNVLIGRNGSGKSTVLEAVYIASAWATETDWLLGARKLDRILSRRTGRGSWTDSRESLWFMMETEQPIEIELVFDGGSAVFALFAQDTEGHTWLKTVDGGKVIYYNHADRKIVRSEEFGVTMHADTDLIRRVSSKLSHVIKVLERVTLIDSQLLSNPVHVERRVWSRLLARRLDKRIVEMLREEYERDAEDLTYMPVGNLNVLAVKLSRTTVRIDDLGDGARHATLIAAIVLTLRDTIVLIEDPENHQHPAGLRVLLEFLARVAKENRLQLIISTQSIELLEILRRVCEKRGLDMRIFFLERPSDGVVSVRALKSVDADVLHNLGLDVRFLDVI